MGRCRLRPVAYQIGLGFMTLGFVLVALSYGLPTWVRISRYQTEGLWYRCGSIFTDCAFITVTDREMEHRSDVFLWAVRAVLGASLLMYLLTFTMALRENCCSPNYYTCCLAGRKTEVLAFLAELTGIAGMLLYGVDEYEQQGHFMRLSWGHALGDCGLAVSLVGSIMMACAQQALPSAKAAAGRIVAKPGYESLAGGGHHHNHLHHNNNRSASLQSRSTQRTQASPFQGRNSTTHISGPFPTPAAIAAVNAAVSPKQQRPMSAAPAPPTSCPQPRKMSSSNSCGPYPILEQTSVSASPKRRKSSGAMRQFSVGSGGGYSPQGKPPPPPPLPTMLPRQHSLPHEQEEWRVQGSATWSEEMRDNFEDDGLRKQRALKSQMEQQLLQRQQGMIMHHANTWSVANERERERAWAHAAAMHDQNPYDRDWRATATNNSIPSPAPQTNNPRMPPPPAPPSTVAPADSYAGHYGIGGGGGGVGGGVEGFSYSEDPSASQAVNHYSNGQWGYPPQEYYNNNPQQQQQQHQQQPQQPQQQQQQQPQQQQQLLRPDSGGYHQRPDSGSFPDPPPPEQLLCYEEERSADTSFYHGYPNPIPEPLPQQQQQQPNHVQPVVLYRAPSQPGQSPVTETVAFRSPPPLDNNQQPQYHHYNNNYSASSPPGSPQVPSFNHLNHNHNNMSPVHQKKHHLPPVPPPKTSSLHNQQQHHHQTFPRQQPVHAAGASPHSYSTFGR